MPGSWPTTSTATPWAVTGVIDFGDMTAAFKPLFNQIDHHLLNEVEGLDDPSADNIARWVYERLRPTLPLLHRVVVVESEDARGAFPTD